METNKFLYENINSAILCSQYDLRGFVHALGFRVKELNAKCLSYIPINLITFSAGCGKKDKHDKDIPPTVNNETMIYYNQDLTYEKVFLLCKKFASECNYIQKEAIQFLVKDILDKTEELKKAAELKGKPDVYIRPLDKKSNWGMIMLGLMEAFEVKADEPIVLKYN